MNDSATLRTSVRRAVGRSLTRIPSLADVGARIAGTPRGSRAPALEGLPLLGNLRTEGSVRLDAMMRASLEIGHVVRFELPWITAHMLTHPDHVEEVLVTRHRAFDKRTRGYDKLRELLGQGLLTSDGDFWLRQRRIAAPAFHKRRIDGFAQTMAESTHEMVERWSRECASGGDIDVSAEMMRLTLRIAARTLLSTDTEGPNAEALAEAVGDAVTVVNHEANQRINELVSVPDFVPTARNRSFRKAKATLDATVYGIIEERRRALARGLPTPDDLLQMFLEATDAETGARMNDEQVRDEVMTMFLAGHETTANALAWSFVLLGRAPDVARSLHDEAVSVLGDRLPTAEDASRLELAKRVFAETLRLYPPVWILGRSVVEETEIGGFTIPKNSLVFLSPWVTHRHPEFWSDPEGFDPDRFSPERKQAQHRHQYFPFIAGPRMCIGAGFAQLEGALVLAQIARRFRLELRPGQRIEPEPMITLRPRDGVRVRLVPW